MKKYWQCLLPPVASGALCLIVFAIFQLFPFAQRTLSWCDMNQQVVPLLLDLKNVLSGQSDLFLNMANAGGTSFWGILLFFVSSPFSLLVAFIDTKDIYLFANILVFIKIVVCAGTASLFFRNKFTSLHVLQNIALSVMYAFCGYTMMYFQNVVWLDMMYMFPILLLGMDRIIQKEKVLLYIIALTAMITIHFYLCYMVAIFLILAIGLYTWFCVEKERRKKVVCLFGISTLIVLCITGIVWVPSLLQYLQSGRGTGIIESLSSGSFISEVYTTVPIITCTAILIAIVPLYFICKKYKKKKLNIIGILFLLTLLPIFIEPINKMWHTGSYQAFPARYGYITVFLGLIIAADMLNDFNPKNTVGKISVKKNAVMIGSLSAGIIVVAAVGFLLIFKQWDTLTVYTKTLHGSYAALGLFVLFALAAAIFYFFVLLLYYLNLMRKLTMCIFLCLMTIVDVMFCGSIYFGSASRSTFSNEAVLDLQNKIDDNELYRVKMDKKYFDVNMVGALGYNSLSHYTSFTNESYMFTMKKLGYSSYWMEVNSNGGTALTDSLLGNRYHIVLNTDVTDEQEIIYQNSKYSIVKNELPSTFGSVFTAEDMEGYAQLPDGSREEIQNALFKAIYHTSDDVTETYSPITMDNIVYHQSSEGLHTIQKELSSDASYLLYTIPVEGTQTLYFDCFHELSNNLVEPINSSFDVYVNGSLVQSKYPSQSSNGLLELGTFTDETVVVKVDVRKNVIAKSFGVFGIKLDTLTKHMDNKTAVSLEQKRNTITGTVDAMGENQYLFLPIGYVNGFKATVNGEEAEIYQVFDTFMAIKLQNGTNTVTVSYVPNGFITGGILSAAGILLCIGFILLLNKNRYRYIRFVEYISYPIIFALFAIVIIAVYIAPMIIYIIS